MTTGKIAWELPQIGPGGARGGTLATASGLLFFCDDQDRFAAVDYTPETHSSSMLRYPL